MTHRLRNFFIINALWVATVGALLYVTGIGVESLLAKVLITILYMPAPMVSAIIVSRGINREWLKFPDAKVIPKFLIWTIGAFLVFAVVLIGTIYLCGNVLHGQVFGEVLTTIDQLKQQLINLLHPTSTQIRHIRLPSSVGPFYIAIIAAAVVAGGTINAVIAMLEEYGWRGFVWSELRKLGWLKANLILGPVWGLWHAPLILMGYNFGASHALTGVFVMIAFTTGASLVLTALRERFESVWSAAMFHGMVNGLGSAFGIIIIGGSVLWNGLVGLVASCILIVIGAFLWATSRHP